MPTLDDMLTQNRQAMDLLARQFNLSQQQAQLAVEALAPAFSQGLKRNAADPQGIAGFLQAMASGQHAKYFEDAAAAFQPSGTAEGNGILGHLFGSKDVSRAVAAQAAQATGIGQSILQQMLPVLASMIMGGLFKQSTGQMGGQANAQATAASNPLGQILEQIMGGGLGGMGGAARQGDGPGNANPFGKALEGMFGGGGGGNPLGNNPLGQMLEQMMGGGAASQPTPQPQANPSGRARTPYDDLFGNMFDTAAKGRDDYQKNVESIFDKFLGGMEKRR